MDGGEEHPRQREQYLCESSCSGRWDNWCGACSQQQWRGVGKVAGISLIHGFVVQAESFAVCSVSNREPSKVFSKAEE